MPIKLVRVSKDNSKAAQDMAQEWITKLSRQVWAHSSTSGYVTYCSCLARGWYTLNQKPGAVHG
jgi:hypothetical protein